MVDSGAADNVMAKRDPRMEKGFKGPGGEHMKNYGQQVMSVRTPYGCGRMGTWQVADVRGPFVSASHNIQAGSDLFIGITEAHSMNTKNKKKSVLRKEGNVSMEVDAINQVADGREQRKRVAFDCNSPTF